MAVKYQRVLLKVSGEALAGAKGTGFDEATIASICAGIKAAHDLGVQIGIVVGGGNFWRGRSSGKMDRMDADKIGMLATVMNAIAVKNALRQQGVPAVVMTSAAMPQVADTFRSDKAIAELEAGRIVVFGGGTGNPIFSTDTASALRAPTPCSRPPWWTASMTRTLINTPMPSNMIPSPSPAFWMSGWPLWIPPPLPCAGITGCRFWYLTWATRPILPAPSRGKTWVPSSVNDAGCSLSVAPEYP